MLGIQLFLYIQLNAQTNEYKKTLPTKKTNKEKNPLGLKNLLGSMDFFEATTDKKM